MPSFESSDRDRIMPDSSAIGSDPLGSAVSDSQNLSSCGEQYGEKGSLDQCLLGVDRRWPQLKYYSLALYAAWILLTMTNNGVTGGAGEEAGARSVELYLFSGVPLSACLIAAAVFSVQAKKLLNCRPFVFAMGAIASVATFCLAMGIGIEQGRGSDALFLLFCVLTGVGTSFVCLRIGCLYSTPPQGLVPFFMIAKAMLVANLLFFMCVCLPDILEGITMSLFPVLAALASLVGEREAGSAQDQADLVSVKALPRGFFQKLLFAILAFSVVVGIVKGFSAILQSNADIEGQAILAVFASFVAVGLIMLVAGIVLTVRNYEVSKIYFPLIVCACTAVLLCSIGPNAMGALQNVVINVGYNIFITAVWALLSDLSERTTVSAVRVFGIGRGASGLGTTAGWFVAHQVTALGIDPSGFLVLFFLVAAVVVFAVVLLVLGQQTVSEALDSMFEGYAREGEAVGSPSAAPIDSHSVWEEACTRIAAAYQLTSRESEVLELLSRGRTGGYIALELGISQNTVKGHTRNVYMKVGVHSRQELIDLIERELASSRG